MKLFCYLIGLATFALLDIGLMVLVGWSVGYIGPDHSLFANAAGAFGMIVCGIFALIGMALFFGWAFEGWGYLPDSYDRSTEDVKHRG